MEEFLKDIYDEASLFTELKLVVGYCRQRNSHYAVMKINELLPKFIDIYNEYALIDITDAERLTNSIKILGETKDLLLVGDIIEGNILPILDRYMQHKGRIDVEADGNLKLESSRCGFLTVKDMKENKYMHSIIDPMWEARQLALSFFDYRKEKYSILGCGLGYLPYQLYCLTEGSVPIHVYEREQRIVDYARNYGVLDWIPNEVLHITVNESVLPFLDSLGEEKTEAHIFDPEWTRIPLEIRSIMNDLYVRDISAKTMEHVQKINIVKNLRSTCRDASELKFAKQTKKFVVVAAGPSVDECLDYLKKQTDKIVIAVGTIFKKLIKNGIVPDLVVVIDPQEITLQQFDGVMDSQVPLLIDCPAYWGFADQYQVPKYMVPVESKLKEMKEYYKNTEKKVWKGGGTVTYFAIEAANYFGAEEIYLVGVDLAYPNRHTHATDTMDYRKIMSDKHLIQVKDVQGRKVF